MLAEREFTADDPADLAALRAFVGTDSFDDSTAVWSTLDHAYDLAGRSPPLMPADRCRSC